MYSWGDLMDDEKRKAIISDAFLAKLMGGDYKTMFDDTMLDHHKVSYIEMNDFLHEVIPFIDNTYEAYELKVFEAADSLSEGVLCDLQKHKDHMGIMLENYTNAVRRQGHLRKLDVEEFMNQQRRFEKQLLEAGVSREEIDKAEKRGKELAKKDNEVVL
jgi:hypothetical protein